MWAESVERPWWWRVRGAETRMTKDKCVKWNTIKCTKLVYFNRLLKLFPRICCSWNSRRSLKLYQLTVFRHALRQAGVAPADLGHFHTSRNMRIDSTTFRYVGFKPAVARAKHAFKCQDYGDHWGQTWVILTWQFGSFTTWSSSALSAPCLSYLPSVRMAQ